MTWKIWFIILKNVSVMKDSDWGKSYQVEKAKATPPEYDE